MKRTYLSYFYAVIAVVLCFSCSVKKDKLMNRAFNAMTAKYNILFNGYLAYDEALLELENNYFDNYWEILPIERINLEIDPTKEFQKGMSLDSKNGSVLDNFSLLGGSPSKVEDPLDQGSGFARAENKATKAIQKHSMYINGRERNWEMDNAYLLLGKARYYDGRYIPALEAFNYIMYKYPDGQLIDEAIIWREKTNLRLSYEDIAIKNLNEFLAEKKGRLTKENQADAYAILAQAYINIEQGQKAIAALKKSIEFTSDKSVLARYLFVLGQLYIQENKKAEAYSCFEQILSFNRKIPRVYLIQSLAKQFEITKLSARDSVAFLKQYNKLIADRENRPYLDVLNRQVGLFYKEISKDEQAIKYLKVALKHFKVDTQLKANNYLSLADIYFNNAGYAQSGAFYDSALAILPEKYPDRFRLEKRRDALKDVVFYENIAKVNDSILRLVAMSQNQRNTFFTEYIENIRKEDFRKLQANLKSKNRNSNVDYFNMTSFGEAVNQSVTANSQPQNATSFYFYSTQASSYGKIEFKKKWGNRILEDNWKWESSAIQRKDKQSDAVPTEEQSIGEPLDNRYNLEYYLSSIPTDSSQIASLKTDRDFAYFQLGSMYSDRFKKFDLAIYRLEALLEFEPAQRLILPTMYKLYKIYLETDPAKAMALKQRIIDLYPDSRYAKLLQNVRRDLIDDLSPEQRYTNVYRIYQSGDLDRAYAEIQEVLENYDNDYISLFELLKAQIIAQKEGLQAYKDALNFIALTYSSTPEGKKAEELLNTVVKELEQRGFGESLNDSWKIVVRQPKNSKDSYNLMQRKMIDFATLNKSIGVKYSEDKYDDSSDFIVLHGFNSKQDALKILERLDLDQAEVINTVNYSTVLINKNWELYLQQQTNKQN
ncbi:type IX secretion system periplasmic lipoprotein PorW/SprE [Myroides sp. LJL115]